MKNIAPINYKITLEPDLRRFDFSGEVEILVEASKPVTEITLNAVELAIWSCEAGTKNEFAECTFHVDPPKEEVTFHLPREMAGRILLRIRYTGLINDKMAGFYRSQYKAHGKARYIAVTQFEESDARRAFPCFDHPVKKATFEVEMVVEKGLTAISNGPLIEEETQGDGEKRLRFEKTPKMSTYLLFFGVGEFDLIEDSGDVVVRVVTIPGMTKYGQFGLEFGRKALEFCERYYGIAYPLQKLDLIAIPDFAFGAMENWGAIIFRENLLLHYPDLTSKGGEQRICEVIAHEIAHQWFGNLVSPSDWKYLWLNESFATYFGYGVVHHYRPEWDAWEQFLESETDQALERDALRETFPIELPGGGQVAITEGSAPIIYNKGGSILRQVEDYIGSDNFQKGLRTYLGEHEYGCASSHHLWDAFEAASEKPVTRMMQSWVEQPGFPIVEVERSGVKLLFTQKRFTYLPHDTNQQWLVPISIRLFYEDGESTRITTLLEGRTKSIDIGKGVLAYKINDGQAGFYRVKYLDEGALNELGKRVLKQELGSEDRWGLQNDLYALVRRGDTSIDEYVDFLANYKNEDAFLPLMSIAGNLFYGFLVMEGPRRQKVASIGRSMIERALQEIGFEPKTEERHTLSILRDRIIWHAVVYGSKTVEEFAHDKFQALVGGKVVHPDLRKSVMRVGALTAGEEAFDWFDQSLRSSESEHERMNILTALGCFGERALIERAQRYILDQVPSRNKFVPIASMASNPRAQHLMWDWFVSNLERIEQFHPIHFERVIATITPLSGIGREEEVRSFFKEYMDGKDKAKDVIKLSLEKLEINSRIRSK